MVTTSRCNVVNVHGWRITRRRCCSSMFVNVHTCTLFRDCGMPVMISKFDDYANIFDRLEHVAGAARLNPPIANSSPSVC